MKLKKISLPISTLLIVSISTIALSTGWSSEGRSAIATTPATAIPTRAELIAAVLKSSSNYRVPQTFTPSLNNVWQTPVSINPVLSSGVNRTGCAVNTNSTQVATDPGVQCAYGDLSASKSILVIGDSNAAMWVPALDTFGYLNHVKIIALTHGGCSPWSRPWMPQTVVFTSNFTEQMCEAWRTSALAKGLALNPNLVIPVGIDMLSPFAAPRPNLEAAIAGLVSRIGASRTLFLEPPPKFVLPTSLTACVSGRPTSLNVCEVKPSWSDLNSVTVALRKISQQRGVSLVATKALFCGTTYCPVFVNIKSANWLVYADGFHITQRYSQLLGKSLDLLRYVK